MRKMIFIWLLVPVFGIGQEKNVMSANRIFPKPDKMVEFKKGLAAHARKYHTGDWKWRVWDIVSGPDAGGYMITEGPNSWARLDERKDISTEHTEDFDKNVMPYVTDRGSHTYAAYNAELSTVALTDFADKIMINHVVAKPGKIYAVRSMLKNLKNAWQAGNQLVAVYAEVSSGEPGFLSVTRMKAGFKELADDYGKPLMELYNSANGAGSFDVFLKDYADAVQKRWSELLVYVPELSSK